MTAAPDAQGIARRVHEILARGVDLAPETVRFIDATLPEPTAAALERRLAEDGGSEAASLLELLFSPDESARRDIEAVLPPHGAAGPVVAEMAEALCRPAVSVAFRLPGTLGAFRVALTPPRARRFLELLHIDRPLPEPLAAAVDERLSGTERLRLRVLIRGARKDAARRHTEVLVRLVERLGFEDEGGWEAFGYALDVLSGLDAGADIYGALEERRRLLAKALRIGRRQREQLAAEPFETLVGRGLRRTHVDEAEVRRQMAGIDRICLAAFGRLPPLDGGEPEAAVAVGGLAEIGDLLRRRP